MQQVSAAPTAKTAAGFLAGAVSMIVVWAMHQWAKVDVPAEIALAFSTVLSFFAAYFMPPSLRDHIQAAPEEADDPKSKD